MSIRSCPMWCPSWCSSPCFSHGRGACSAPGRSSTVFKATPRASGYLRTGYAEDFALIGTRLERVSLSVFIVALLLFPLVGSAFQIDLACQVFLAAIGSL